jgi:hypothetical protein
MQLIPDMKAMMAGGRRESALLSKQQLPESLDASN